MSRIIGNIIVVGLCAGVVLPLGCVDQGDPADTTFRDLDIDIQLEQADGGDDDGTVLWEILDGGVYDGAASQQQLSLVVDGDDIISGTTTTCEFDGEYLRDAPTGAVIFTVWDDYVFDGQIDTSSGSYWRIMALYSQDLLFHVDGDEVYDGLSSSANQLLLASADLDGAGNEVRLLIGALILGECGATPMY